MGLLQDDERQNLIDRLLRLPNIRETGVRRSLVAGLPEELRNTVTASDVPRIEVMSIVELVDGDAWGQLADESWSIIRVVENSVVQVRGSKLGAELEALLNTLKSRAVKQSAAPKTEPKLSGKQFQALHEAILSAFPTESSLEIMVRFGLNETLNRVVASSNLQEMVFDLIEWAQARGRVPHLVYGALKDNPGNEALRSFAEEMGLVASSPVTPIPPPSRPQPETPGRKTADPVFIDVESWRARMSEAEPTVCRVELSEVGSGTGFLVGPSVAMTSYHVVSRFIENTAEPHAITLRFGYKMAPDGLTVYRGQIYQLADDWLVDSDKSLAFAVLRVAGSPGDEPAGPGAPPRRWLNPKAKHTFNPDDPMYLIQHPRAAPLKIAYEQDSVVSVNPEQTRVTYRMSTAPGSGGAPCFTAQWELVAIHQGKSEGTAFGTPMQAIVSRPKVKAALGT